MSKYIRLYKDDNPIDTWAHETLTTEELAQYKAAVENNDNLWESYRTQGLYSIQHVYQTVYSAILDHNIDIIVGEEIVMSPGTNLNDLQLDNDLKIWVDRYAVERGTIDPQLVEVV